MRVHYLVAAGAAMLVCTGTASAAFLGQASDYNVFIFGNGDFMSEDTDTMGDLAAGGNISLTSYAVAGGIAGDPAAPVNPARLVVGGQLTATGGGVGSDQNGTIYYGSAAPSLSGFTARGGEVANQTVVSFAGTASYYGNLSTELGALTSNGTTQFDDNGNTLSFSGSLSGLNVFNVSVGTLSTSQSIDISAPTGSTVLINVTGTTSAAAPAMFQNGSVTETGVSGAYVLYNFVSAANVDLVGSKDPEGSILAPLAGVTGGFGSMTGQLIAASYDGNTQFNEDVFSGTLPTPLPAAAWLLLSGVGGLRLILARRRAAP